MELLQIFPQYFIATVVFLLGLIIGSFLDVIACRFHTGKSINGRSRCMSCGHTLSWYELFPLASYLILRGRCKNCNGNIPVRLLVMELVTGASFLLAYFTATSLLSLGLALVLVSLLVVIAVYDMKHMVIPHEFVFASLALACVSLLLHMDFAVNATFIISHLVSAVGVSLFYASLWVISKGRWIGLGDAKLAFPLALMLSPLEGFSMVVLSFWIGAGVSVVLLLAQKMLHSGKKHLPFLRIPLTMKSEVPFAPFMLLAFLAVFLMQVNVLSFMENLL